MKIRLLIILGLLVWGWLKPIPALAADVCTNGPDDYCKPPKERDVPIGCEKGYGNFCQTVYDENAQVYCRSDCTYPVISAYWNGSDIVNLYKCVAGAVPPNCRTSVESTTVGPGTCCVNDGPGGSPPPGGCGTTAPGNLSINRNYSPTQARASWNPGTGGNRQAFGASSNVLAVYNLCAGAYRSDCVIYEPILSSSLNHYEENKTTFTEAGTVYYFKVINVASGSCSKSTTRPWLSSCTLTPGSSTLEIGETKLLTMNIVDSPSIRQVNFSSDNAAVTVDPGVDSGTLASNNETYRTTATAVAAGTATITATARLFNGEYGEWSDCAATATVTVNGSGPAEQDAWWQAVGGDVHADSGNIVSDIPATCTGSCKPYLITEAVNGTTGALSRSGNISVGSGGLTEDGKNWNLVTSYQGIKTDYAYFERILESNPVASSFSWDGSQPVVSGVFLGSGVTATSGSDWTIPSGVKAIILAPNNLRIAQNITVQSGGFLAVISSGNITFANSVTNVEGVYVADGSINTCATTSCASALTASGSFAAWGGFNLRRDLSGVADATAPGEKFTYRPDLMINAYEYISRSRVDWQEVAP